MAPVDNWPYEPTLKKEARTLVRVYQGQRCVLGSCRGQSGWEAVAEKTDPFFFSILLMLNVLPCWASSRIQIKSINKDTFCFHLKLSPPRGPREVRSL